MRRQLENRTQEPRVRPILLAATSAFAVLSAALFSPPVAASTRSAGAAEARTAAPCKSTHLVVWLDTSSGGAAAGSTYYRIEFTNEGTSSCSLSGYPGVSAINLAGTQVGAAAGRNPAISAKPVTIAKGATATAVVQITDVTVYPNATCRSAWAAGLRVYPPGQTVAKTVPFPFHACSLKTEIDLHIEAVERGIFPQ